MSELARKRRADEHARRRRSERALDGDPDDAMVAQGIYTRRKALACQLMRSVNIHLAQCQDADDE